MKVFDVVNTVPGELWMKVHNIGQEAANKTILKKKKSKKAKWLSEAALQIAEERSEKQGRKGKKHATLIARDHMKSCRETKPKSATGKSTMFN